MLTYFVPFQAFDAWKGTKYDCGTSVILRSFLHMDMGTILLVACGALAGVASGLFGIGGGLIITPFLSIALGYSQHQANGTSLVALLAPVGILGVYAYYRSGKIGAPEIKAGLLIALGLSIGAYFGARVATSLSPQALRRVFAVFLVAAALRLWWQK